MSGLEGSVRPGAYGGDHPANVSWQASCRRRAAGEGVPQCNGEL